MSGARHFFKQRERARTEALQSLRELRWRIVSVERHGMLDAVCVSYLAHERRNLTRQQAEREPEVRALCTWWHK